MTAREFLISWDTLIAVIIAAIGAVILPEQVKCTFARDLYLTGLTMLSLIFSVYFAAFAIIITASDNDFIRFLEEEKDFTALISQYRFTLGGLFVALICSIAFYAGTSYYLSMHDNAVQSKWLLIVFAFLASYSLIATALSVRDALKYAQFRARFILMGKRK